MEFETNTLALLVIVIAGLLSTRGPLNQPATAKVARPIAPARQSQRRGSHVTVRAHHPASHDIHIH